MSQRCSYCRKFISKKGSGDNPTIILDKKTSVHLCCLSLFDLQWSNKINISDGEYIITKYRIISDLTVSKIVKDNNVFWYFDDVTSMWEMMSLIRCILLYFDVPETLESKFYALHVLGKHHVIQKHKGSV
jgi:hypothetical protein